MLHDCRRRRLPCWHRDLVPDQRLLAGSSTPPARVHGIPCAAGTAAAAAPQKSGACGEEGRQPTGGSWVAAAAAAAATHGWTAGKRAPPSAGRLACKRPPALLHSIHIGLTPVAAHRALRQASISSSAAAICSASAHVSIAKRTASSWITSASTREAAAVPSSECSGWVGSWLLQAARVVGPRGGVDAAVKQHAAACQWHLLSSWHLPTAAGSPAEHRLPHVHQTHVLRFERMEVIE